MDCPNKTKLTDSLLNGDKRLLYFIYTTIRCRVLNLLMPYITNLGGARFVIGTSIIIFAIIDRQLGSEVIVALAASHLVVQIIKRVANRPRPYITLQYIKELTIPFEPHSFPSGHTTAIFSLAVTLSFYLPAFSLILILLATLVGISRVYLGVHYPSDVLMGGLLGSCFAYLIHINFFI
ncbi:MAG: phosphatase PAP2 family protein [Bacillota bacterium]